METLTIHIIVNGEEGLRDAQGVFVNIKGQRCIAQFQKILNTEGYDKAALFAISKGRLTDGSNKKGPWLILTKNRAHWDLMG